MADTTVDGDPLEQAETPTSAAKQKADIAMRTVLADTYTFVRSNEINKTISSFTFDHYIDEAKRAIKEDRVLRSASSPSVGVGSRPSQLTALTKLEQDFNNMLAKLQSATQDSSK